MRPSSFVWNYKAAWTLVGKTGDPSNAQPYLARAAENLSTEIYRVHPEAAVNVELYEVYRQWVSGDSPQVLKDEDLIANLYSSRASNIQDLILRELGLVSLAFGKLEKAESLFLSISNYRIRHELLARLLFSRWDDEAMKRHLIKNSFYQDPFTAILMTRVGLQNMATTLVEDLERQGVPPAQLKIIKGKLALDRGQRQEAISLLNDGIDEIVHPAHGLFFAGADILAGAWSKQGDPGKAVQVLQRTSRRRNQAAFSGTADLWVRCQLRLAQIYKRIGRRAEVAEIKAQLQQAMAHADTDHPLLGKLRQL